MPKLYNPGCALMLYKPHYADKLLKILGVKKHDICCHHNPNVESGTEIINTCAGCDKRFGSLYEGVSTISLWEVIAKDETFPFPNYDKLELSVHDACPVRNRSEVHDAIRELLKKMNIKIVEAEKIRKNSICCGDNFYPSLPIEKVHEKMRERANSMPTDDVCVYCVSCIKSMNIGGKRPRYILDLLFNEQTESKICDTVKWHEQINDYMESTRPIH